MYAITLFPHSIEFCHLTVIEFVFKKWSMIYMIKKVNFIFEREEMCVKNICEMTLVWNEWGMEETWITNFYYEIVNLDPHPIVSSQTWYSFTLLNFWRNWWHNNQNFIPSSFTLIFAKVPLIQRHQLDINTTLIEQVVKYMRQNMAKKSINLPIFLLFFLLLESSIFALNYQLQKTSNYYQPAPVKALRVLSLQQLLEDMGYGQVTNPIFNRAKKRLLQLNPRYSNNPNMI